MYGGYYGGWEPSTYITKDIPLTVYESKAGKPYMNIKGWAEDKEPDDAKRSFVEEHLPVSQDDEVPSSHDKGAQKDLQTHGISCIESYVTRV